jgi:hypothetical protein
VGVRNGVVAHRAFLCPDLHGFFSAYRNGWRAGNVQCRSAESCSAYRRGSDRRGAVADNFKSRLADPDKGAAVDRKRSGAG